MANYSTSSYMCVGDQCQVDALYKIMSDLESRDSSLIENGYGKTWLGNLVKMLGGDPYKVYCRGSWSGLKRTIEGVYFDCEHAWSRPDEVEELIREKFEEVEIYFICEELGTGIFETNDHDGTYFENTVIIDTESGGMEYYTDEEALKALSEMLGREISDWAQAEDEVEEYNDSVVEGKSDTGRIWLHRVDYIYS